VCVSDHYFMQELGTLNYVCQENKTHASRKENPVPQGSAKKSNLITFEAQDKITGFSLIKEN